MSEQSLDQHKIDSFFRHDTWLSMRHSALKY